MGSNLRPSLPVERLSFIVRQKESLVSKSRNETDNWVFVASLGGYQENVITPLGQSLDQAGIPHSTYGSAYWATKVPPDHAVRAREVIATQRALIEKGLMIIEPDGQPRGWGRSRGDFWGLDR